MPPRTIGNWCVTGRTVGDRRTPKILQGLESNPPSDRSSRNGGAANVNGWSVNSSLVHVLGTTSTFCPGNWSLVLGFGSRPRRIHPIHAASADFSRTFMHRCVAPEEAPSNSLGLCTESDLPHWMVRNASSVMLIGTDATNALGRQNQHERPSSAHSGQQRNASLGHSRRPATATARQRLPVPGSEQPAAADAGARSSKYSQWSRPASASAPQSPSHRGKVSTARKFLTSDGPGRPVSREGGMLSRPLTAQSEPRVSREGGMLSRPSTAQSRLGSTSRSNQDRNYGEKSGTALNRTASAAEHGERMKKGYGMSLLIPAMLSADDTQVRPTTPEKNCASSLTRVSTHPGGVHHPREEMRMGFIVNIFWRVLGFRV